MALMKWERRGWDPMAELAQMSTQLDRLFERVAGNGGREALTAEMEWAPRVNVSETERVYRIVAEIPGIEKKDVHVKLDEGMLTIEGERRRAKDEKGEKFHRVESYYGRFVRRFTMPEDADDKKIDATFKDGVLTITIDKTVEKKTTRAQEIAVH
jgi:HSP20 family protein